MAENSIEKKRKTSPLLVISIILLVAMIGLSIYQFSRSRGMKDELNSCDRQITRYDSLLRSRNAELAAWKDIAEKEVNNRGISDSIPHYKYNEGVFFEVQIGSFTDFNLDEYLDEMVEIRQEKEGISTKLLLGRFRSIKQARLFENDMKRIGIKDAFVIGRVDGKLVDVDEAIEMLKQQNIQ